MTKDEQNTERFKSDDEIAWCPGCGNFAILTAIKTALLELNKQPEEILIVSGIGQAAKLPHYIRTNVFNGLHGRALPPAVAAKIVNPELTVIVHSGDGDTYGEGGNHFLHNIRRNVDIAHFVHDNQIYALTKGQASPTTALGQVTGIQTKGNIDQPLNPIMLALAAGANFVARGFTGHQEHLVKLMKEAMSYPGYALIDILQPCVSFNKVNTHRWYADLSLAILSSLAHAFLQGTGSTLNPNGTVLNASNRAQLISMAFICSAQTEVQAKGCQESKTFLPL